MPKEPLMEKDLTKIISKCKNPIEKQTILILRYTGMHVSVLCEADKSFIKGKFLQWYRPKTGRLVRIPIHPKIKPFLKDYLESGERYRYRQYYNNMIKEIGNRAKIEGLSPMSFRHTFGVSLLDEGYAIPQVQKMMGVTNLNVIMRYTQYSDPQMEKKWKETGWLK